MTKFRRLIFLLGLFIIVSGSKNRGKQDQNSSTETDIDGNGIIRTVSSLNELKDIFDQSTVTDPLVIAFFYKDDCSNSLSLLEAWKKSVRKLSVFSLKKYPLFVVIPAIPSTESITNSLSVAHVPSILFLKQKPSAGVSSSFYTLEYNIGLKSSVSEMFQGIIFYLSRLQNSHFEKRSRYLASGAAHDYLDALTVRLTTAKNIEAILDRYQNLMLQHVLTPLDPFLSTIEHEWIRYILDEENEKDTLRMICQCREDKEEKQRHDYREFDEISSVLSLRRDTIFCIEQDCRGDGIVSSYRILENNWTIQYETSFNPNSAHSLSGIPEFCHKVLRPSILWLDRQMSAPIAFAPFYKLHGVLFVNFHDIEENESMRQIVIQFRRQCQIYRHKDIVCLLVPSTDTRLLTTFGVDMWTQVDQQLIHGSEHESDQHTIFPNLMITDKRKENGVKRFYLNSPFDTEAMEKFFDSICWGRDTDAYIDIKTSSYSNVTRSNTHGVHLLSGVTLESFVSKVDKDALVFFESPTCGHCKRLNIAWNALGDLIEYLEWNDFLEIGKLDVSENEFFIPGVHVTQIPDIFYFGSKSKIQSMRSHMGEVGGISNPLDIVEWWLDLVSENKHFKDIDEISLLRALEAKEKGFAST
jgi:hypothetical protein